MGEIIFGLIISPVGDIFVTFFQTQHAATCRICEFNFGDPAVLLKHMAAVHSVENPPTGLLGAYKCLICRFCSPLYSELVRHFNEYHSRSGWLLCPLCLRVFRTGWFFVLINYRGYKKCAKNCKLVKRILLVFNFKAIQKTFHTKNTPFYFWYRTQIFTKAQFNWNKCSI